MVRGDLRSVPIRNHRRRNLSQILPCLPSPMRIIGGSMSMLRRIPTYIVMLDFSLSRSRSSGLAHFPIPLPSLSSYFSYPRLSSRWSIYSLHFLHSYLLRMSLGESHFRIYSM